MSLPTVTEIEQLHRTYAPHGAAFELVYTHCLVVRDIARQLLERYEGEIDLELVEAGCLLHDIGVYRMYGADGEIDHKNYIRHGILGDELLREIGADARLVRIASHHTGVGLTKEEIVEQKLPLPEADYLAESIEERLIMYADKFHSKTNPPSLLTADRFRRKIAQFGTGKAEAFDAMVAEFGEPDLEVLAAKYGTEIAR